MGAILTNNMPCATLILMQIVHTNFIRHETTLIKVGQIIMSFLEIN